MVGGSSVARLVNQTSLRYHAPTAPTVSWNADEATTRFMNGIGTIRGSGAHDGGFHHKGGPAAFTEMLEALKDGYNIAMTADVPKVARVAGLGIVKLAQHSGRPIYPVAMASSRRIELDNWDRSAVNLPFARMGVVASPAIFVPPDADREALEAARQKVESELNRATARAYEIADKTEGKVS